jgi:N-acyl-D-aspartate/D-glutamate deacylase
MVNRNDATVVATGVNGQVVFRAGEFRDGYGTTVRSGRYLRAGTGAVPSAHSPSLRSPGVDSPSLRSPQPTTR